MICRICLVDKPQSGYIVKGHRQCRRCVYDKMKIYATKKRRENRLQLRDFFREYNKLPWRRKYHREYQRSYRLKKENEIKQIARHAVRDALRKGTLKRGPCHTCGKRGNPQAHHRDYSRPLDVIWFCDLHHKHLHLQLKNSYHSVHS